MATNVMISGSYSNYAVGTMDPNGTLSNEIDLGASKAIGLVIQNFTSGTLEFLVSPYSDSDTYHTSAYSNARTLAAAKIATGTLPTGTSALGGDGLTFLAPFRYVKILAQNAQASSPPLATFTFVMKA